VVRVDTWSSHAAGGALARSSSAMVPTAVSITSPGVYPSAWAMATHFRYSSWARFVVSGVVFIVVTGGSWSQP